MRTSTEKGHELYSARVQTLIEKVKCAWRNLEDLFNNITDESKYDLGFLRQIEDDTNRLNSLYIQSVDPLLDYLQRTRTSKSENELEKQKALDQKRSDIVNQFLNAISHMQLDIVENMSERSLNGIYKTRSVAGSTKCRTSVLQAKKMVANTNLSFLEKERELRKQIIELESRLTALKERKNIAIAEVEMNYSMDSIASHEVHRDIKVEMPSPGEKVKDYISTLPDHPPVDDDLLNTDPPIDNVTRGLSPTAKYFVPSPQTIHDRQAPQVIQQMFPANILTDMSTCYGRNISTTLVLRVTH
ncbi:hypothetical protein LOTGIDRAFT_160708 [Lottia gigantea]|uniref:Uncharacterized protein n=1 Tax=Lottia gigantea TaxID=225164 RepID=V4C0J0_LOTGI|nr:hypothetical protein LOTGIDRAFT_160708 [Lottia gigantea]ESO94954.1 hypothetical protein LOTGIDRAFT_160708 [Lottia gigantea]